MTEKINWVFFGSSQFSIYALDELKAHGILPDLIVTTPDKPKGRKLTTAPTPVKIWAQENNIEVIDPQTLKDSEIKKSLSGKSWDLFLVASYGKIIPKDVFEIPNRKTLNIHPSLLPKYRGASPIQSQILENEKEVGVTIMQIEETMDTGPIVIQKKIEDEMILLGRKQLEKMLAIEGARLFAHILPEWLSGVIDPIMQDENRATYCKKIEKDDGELQIDLDDLTKNARQNILKIKAFEEWPTAYFFVERNGKKTRVIITDATLENHLMDSTSSPQTSSRQAELKILKVIPEGKKEMPFTDFLRGQK